VRAMIEARGFKRVRRTASEMQQLKAGVAFDVMLGVKRPAADDGRGGQEEEERFGVFLATTDKFGVKIARMIVAKIEECNLTQVAIVTKLKSTRPARMEVVVACKRVDFFLEKELRRDIREHALSASHFLLSEQQKQRYLKTNRLKETELHRILSDALIVRFHGWPAMSVLLSTRVSSTPLMDRSTHPVIIWPEPDTGGGKKR